MPLPHFLIIGPPKAGTTALHSALAAHPQLFMSSVKEPREYVWRSSPTSS
jgi:SpoVK/Ycf46/Vps4 family AAA+-type ATPase